MLVGVYIFCIIVLRLLPVLSLTAFWVLIDFCYKGALSCSIDTGVMLKPTSVLCMCLWYRQSWAKYFSSCNINCYRLAVMPRTSHMRFFYLWSVNTFGLAHLVSLWTFNKFWLWLVVQVGDTVALCNWRLQLKNAIGLYLSRNGLTLPVCCTSTNNIALYHGAQ